MINIDAPNFKLTGEAEDPTKFDYNIFGLHKKLTTIKGELIKVEYFKNCINGEYSDLVVEETREYIRDAATLLVQYRNQISKWFLTDDTVGVEKSTVKYYSLSKAIAEGVARRENMLEEAKLYALNAIELTNGQDLLITYGTEMTAFTNGFAQVLKDAIANSTKTYLTQQIKDTIISILNY